MSENACDKVKAIHPWTGEEKRALRELAEWSCGHWPVLYRAYCGVSEELAQAGEKAGYDWNDMLALDYELIGLVQAGQHERAARRMAREIIQRVELYLPGCANPYYLQLRREFKRPASPAP
jgi:hypothetical protein